MLIRWSWFGLDCDCVARIAQLEAQLRGAGIEPSPAVEPETESGMTSNTSPGTGAGDNEEARTGTTLNLSRRRPGGAPKQLGLGRRKPQLQGPPRIDTTRRGTEEDTTNSQGESNVWHAYRVRCVQRNILFNEH